GNAYVYFGSATGPPATPSLTLDNPRDQALGGFGRSVASAGDVNGDGSTDGDGDLSPIARHRSSPQVS
ncbi:MAG: hypothetical protein KAI47_05370, partial [Deltaproteobacteria bacterium]|nr:hypothetical protein [Deltaproteobacteria bacterium]